MQRVRVLLLRRFGHFESFKRNCAASRFAFDFHDLRPGCAVRSGDNLPVRAADRQRPGTVAAN